MPTVPGAKGGLLSSSPSGPQPSPVEMLIAAASAPSLADTAKRPKPKAKPK